MAKKMPNILFFGIDSLRRDHMSHHGYHRLTTPHISAFAQGGVTFDNCYSPSIPTTSGYASMLTGKDCFGTNTVALRHKGDMAPGIKTLAEVLRENGYTSTCVGFDGNPAARGFDQYLTYAAWGSWEQGRSRKAENLNDLALPELERLAGQDKPFLLFMRHMDPHSPYLAPEPFDKLFFQGDVFDSENRSLDKVYQFKPFRDYFMTWFPPGCTSADYVIAQYDAAVAYMDACIQVVLEKLAALGLEEDTLVIVTSDHGETLMDHDCYFDHHGLYDCTLAVPLILRYGKRLPQGVRVGDFCQLKDLMPTILELLGISGDALGFDGRSLLGALNGSRAQEPECYITECTWQRKHGWRTPEWKLIRALEPDFHYREPVELYNLLRDPGECHNLAEEEEAVVAFLTQRMEQWIARREKETGRKNPMLTNPQWHGLEGRGAFVSSDDAYNTFHIGDPVAAQRLQARLSKEGAAK